MRPSSTTRMAGSASGLVLTNHCLETSGSTGVLQRWHVPSGSLWSSVLTSRPCVFEIVDDALAGLKSVETRRKRRRWPVIFACSSITLIERQIVPLARFEVVRIVRGSHLHHAGPELRDRPCRRG